MEVMTRQTFMPVLPFVALALGACSVVGYPGGVSGPLAAAAPPGPRPVEQAPRTYEVFGVRYTTLASSADYEEVGIASWYGEDFHGRRTASGETYDMYGLTAAHRTLPLQTCVEVRRVDDDRAVTVRVNDRGPFDPEGRRIIDLSFSAAEAIGLIARGTAEVEVRALEAERRC
jgi:rare lipoprotein A